jgi:Tfp pilus assembly protein PilZ
MYKIVSYSFVLLLVLFSCKAKQCQQQTLNIDNKMEMLNADKAFSRMCEEKGMKAAYMEYIDSGGILLRPQSMPIIGVDVIDYISQEVDTGYTISWVPMGGTVARSGEGGYTYGTYLVKFKSKDSVLRGTYINVWHRQVDGKWKFVVNSGNEGIGE